MKILLVGINAKYIHTNNAIRLLKANSDFDIDLIEFTIKDDIDEIIAAITKNQYDVIGFSIYIWNISLFINIIDKLPLNSSKFILGGPEVSYESEYFLNKEQVHYILKGESERSFNQLLHCINKNELPNEVPGISFKVDNTTINNPIQEIMDLSTLKSPHHFEFDIKHIKNKISYIESSRGCPYKCSYCLSSLEKKVRFFPLQVVKDEINYLIFKGAKTIKFLDRTFNANKHTFDLFDYIIGLKNHNAVFQFEITGDTLDTSIIQYLNENAPSGLIRFEIGIQSTNYETNLLVDRFQNKDKLFTNIKLIQDKGVIDLHLDLIAGLPKEDITSFKNTFNEVFSLNPKELQLGFLKMLKGTKIRKEAAKYGYIYNQESPYNIICNDFLSEQDIEEILLVERMLNIFHNKGYFGDNVLQYINQYESPYSFFLDIGVFYQNHKFPLKGYQINDVYQAIHDFIGNEEIFAPIKIDYYLNYKVKPKKWDKEALHSDLKNKLYGYASHKHSIPLHKLFKNSRIISIKDNYHIFFYKELEVKHYILHKKDIS